MPLLPILPGFLINTLFYAVIWFALIFGWRAHMRVIRRWRGHCPMCKYDLRGDLKRGCPECPAHGGDRTQNVACIRCHILVPHGGKLSRLIADRKRQLGEEFSMYDFYEEVDAQGVIPVSLIRWQLTGEDAEIRLMTP